MLRAWENLVAFYTLVRKEISRFLRLWQQTLLPSAVTTSLYFIIFGNLVFNNVSPVAGHDYISFIMPGLIMLSVITNSYGNVVSSFFGAKFQRHIEELLVSPMPNQLILIGFLLGGMGRGICVGIVVGIVASFFTTVSIHHFGVMIFTIFFTTMLFSLLGMFNAIFAKKFDDITIIPSFVLTPLIYLGGVFFAIERLSPFWQKVSYFNPIVYIINLLRYSMLDYISISIAYSMGLLVVFTVFMYTVVSILLHKGTRLKS
tara:strand:- start:16711 stop:17487 length:777 start_codon:yes stop_codon:yes gene_type:complete